MLDIDYRQGLDALRTLIQHQRPELLPEFGMYQFRLLENLNHEQTYGHSSDNEVARNQVLYPLIHFTSEHFSLQFIDLCRPNNVLNHNTVVQHTPVSTHTSSEDLWQGGNEVSIQNTRYLLHTPVDLIWTPDQKSAHLQQARALEIGTNRLVFLKQVQIHHATAHAETWKNALEKESRLLGALELDAQQSFPRRLAFVSTPHCATLVQSVLSGRSWQQEFGSFDAPLSTRATRSLLRSAISLCNELKALHTQKFAHRALHPEKVILVNGSHTILRDTGLATWKYMPGEGPELYRAPEQTVANEMRVLPGHATDIYQLGMILYHLITGSLPIPSQFIPLKAWNAELPDELDGALQRALAPNSRERWSTITHFSFALKKGLK